MIKSIRVLGIIFLIIIVTVVVIVVYNLSNTQIRQTKDYATMYVENEDLVDGDVMISPPEKYSQLLQIDVEMRKKVAKYMKNNNYKLKPGQQEFVRNNPTFKELIDDGFEFEKIN